MREMREEVGKKTPKKEMDNLYGTWIIFYTILTQFGLCLVLSLGRQDKV